MAHGKGGAEIAEGRAPTLTCNHDAPIAFLPETAHTLRGEGFDASADRTRAAPIAVALRGREGGATAELGDEVGHTLRASSGGGDKPHVLAAMQVRRLTPRECERLQGFPDDYTRIPWRRKPSEDCPDGPRYKALGNSMAVPVMAWIGRQIQAAHDYEVAPW